MEKTTTNQRPTPEQKYAVVMRVLQKEKSLASICSDEHISSTTALKWVEQFLTNGRQALEEDSSEKFDKRDAELSYLRDEVNRLYAMNDALKRKFSIA
jgi:transposase-like protein